MEQSQIQSQHNELDAAALAVNQFSDKLVTLPFPVVSERKSRAASAASGKQHSSARLHHPLERGKAVWGAIQ